MKSLFTIIAALTICQFVYAQEQSTYKLEIGAIPLVAITKLSLGVSYNPSYKTEHVVKMHGSFFLPTVASTVAWVYNYNRLIVSVKNAHLYIPFWAKARTTLALNVGAFSPDYEGSGNSLDLFISGGSGLGLRTTWFKKHEIRSEVGVGGMYFLYTESFKTDGYSRFFPSLRLNIKYLLPIFNSR